MKYYFDLLLLLTILAINFNCVQNANKIKMQNKHSTLNDNCIEFNSQSKKDLLQKVFEESKFLKNSNTTFFLFFSNKKDNFKKLKAIAGPINRLLAGELNLTFFCENLESKKNVTMDSDENDKKNILNYIVVKNGSVEKNETLTDFSKEFVAHMLNEFKLSDYLEKKYLAPENKGNTSLQTSEFVSFVQFTLNLKESKAKSTEKEAVNESLKEKMTSEKSKKSSLEKGIPKKINSPLKETRNIASNNSNLKNSSQDKKANQPLTNSKNQAGEQSKNKNNLNSNSNSNKQITIQKNSNASSSLKNSANNSKLSNGKGNKKAAVASSFLENELVLSEEPFGASRLIPVSNQYVLSFTQTQLEFNPKDHLNPELLQITEQTSNRLSRFFFAMFIVVIASLLCFLFVKFSIDWATRSKSELLSLNDKEKKEIFEEINQTHNLIKFK